MPPVLLMLLIALIAPTRVWSQASAPLNVESGELTKHPEWIGRELVVDDRVALFQWHPQTLYDQIYLKRCPEVTFELPPKLRMAKSPQSPAVQLRGVLRKGGNHWWFEVSEIELLPHDITRLNRALEILPETETTKRRAWATWAEKRAKSFDDKELLAKALAIETNVIRVEADRPKGDKAAYWLSLAEEARKRQISEPEPSAIFHRAIRQAEKDAKTAADFVKWAETVELFLPDVKTIPDQTVDLGEVGKRYAADPAGTYRLANPGERVALDRRLFEDLTERSLRQRAVETPDDFLAIADESAAKLTNHPELETSLLETGLKTASFKVANLRQSEVEDLARIFRERLRHPERAVELWRNWLDDQRKNRLSPRDAEGRLALAGQYETLLSDKATAIALLKEAWKLDPTSSEIEQAFLSKNFRKVEGEWVERLDQDAPATSDAAKEALVHTGQATGGNARGNASDSLRNVTAEQVRVRMGGNPDRRIRSRSQGQLIEQWIYLGTREDYYINLRRKSGDLQARVVTFFAMPKSTQSAHPAP